MLYIEQPFSVASYLNPIEEDSGAMLVHLVEKVEQDQFKFLDKIGLAIFENQKIEIEKIYYIVEDGSLSKELTML